MQLSWFDLCITICSDNFRFQVDASLTSRTRCWSYPINKNKPREINITLWHNFQKLHWWWMAIHYFTFFKLQGISIASHVFCIQGLRTDYWTPNWNFQTSCSSSFYIQRRGSQSNYPVGIYGMEYMEYIFHDRCSIKKPENSWQNFWTLRFKS